MPKTRSLADLFVRGVELTLDDGGGAIQVWLQKLNPVERETVIRKADSARARSLAGQNDKESEIYLSAIGDIDSLDRETKITMLVESERSRVTPMVQEEISLQDQWANEDYLQGLRDSWADKLNKRFLEDPDDVEAQRVQKELQRYVDQVNEAIEVKMADHRAQFSEAIPEKEIDNSVLKLTFKLRGDMVWVNEYQRSEIWQAVRKCEAEKTEEGWDHSKCDHKEKALPTRDDVDALMEPTLARLSGALLELTVDPLEGKDSPVVPAS
jgi:hypothetical protein